MAVSFHRLLLTMLLQPPTPVSSEEREGVMGERRGVARNLSYSRSAEKNVTGNTMAGVVVWGQENHTGTWLILVSSFLPYCPDIEAPSRA
jgi:hypothetical protein